MKVRDGESPDILTAAIPWPATWYLFGSGPNALQLTDERINEIARADAVRLAVNGGIMLDYSVYNYPDTLRITMDYWLVTDHNVANYKWFPDAFASTTAVKIFGPQYPPGFGDYSFIDGPALNWNSAFPMPGVLRCGATVGCMALQLAHHSGAKEIYLIGMDQFGNHHVTGETDSWPEHAQKWNSVNRFSGVIKYIQNKGVYVAALTDTALDVEVLR